MTIPHGPLWICVPTYNEAEHVERLVRAILAVTDAAGLDAHVLIADDASPDGTGDIADALTRVDSRVHVLHRARKEGIGPAYRDAFRTALAAGAGLIMEMDCDFSHDPAAIPTLVAATADADLVLGSRYVAGGAVRDWALGRRAISRAGCVYAKWLLGMSVSDLTGGFKCFRRRVLEMIPLDDVQVAGYGFQIEMTYRAARLGFRVVEVPITFSERREGKSKMSGRIVREAALLAPRLRLKAWRKRL